MKRLGVALSGGGARGLVHIGVLKVLAEAGISIHCIAGTSMGGLVGALYAAGRSPEALEQFALTYARRRALWRLADFGVPRKGLIKGEQFETFLREQFEGKTFADLRIPLTVVAVDLNSGQEVWLREGDLARAVRASGAVPGLLAPVEMDGMRLVDGGLLNNLPVDAVHRQGAEVVLGVDAFSDQQGSFWRAVARKRLIAGTIGDLLINLGDALDLVIRAHSKERLERYPPDVLLQPPIPPTFSAASGFDHAAELIAAGETAMRQALPALQAALERTETAA